MSMTTKETQTLKKIHKETLAKFKSGAYLPDFKDPRRKWIHIGGDLEASYDGFRSVDIREISSHKHVAFMSRGTVKSLLALFKPEPEYE